MVANRSDNWDRLRTFAEGLTAPYVFFANDRETRLTYVSPSVRSVLGYEPSEVIGRSFRDFIVEDHVFNQDLEDCYQRRFGNDETGPHCFLRVASDSWGRRHVFETQTFGRADATGRVVENCGIARKLDRPLSAERVDLTGPVSASRRVPARKSVEQSAYRAKLCPDDVRALIHELGQPVFATQNLAEALLRTAKQGALDQGNLTRIVDSLNASTQRASRILGDFRSLIRAELAAEEDIGLSDFLRSAAEATRADGRRHGVRITLEDLPQDVRFQGNRHQLTQVLVNLISNAVDACREAEPGRHTVSVGAREAGGALEFTVADSGEGLDPQREALLFHSPTTSKPDGVGIGLLISRGIVERHGGRLWHTPGRHRGSVFHFTIPLRETTA